MLQSENSMALLRVLFPVVWFVRYRGSSPFEKGAEGDFLILCMSKVHLVQLQDSGSLTVLLHRERSLPPVLCPRFFLGLTNGLLSLP